MSVSKDIEDRRDDGHFKLSLLVLMGLARPRNTEAHRLYKAQLRSVDRFGPIQLLFTIIGVAAIWGVFQHSPTVPRLYLDAWTALAVLTGGAMMRASLVRGRSEYAGVEAATIIRNGLSFLLLGALWSVPTLFFVNTGVAGQVIALWTLASCVMVGTAIAYSGLPMATLCLICSIGASSVWMMWRAGSPMIALLVTCYALVMLIASLKHAREFGRQMTTTHELAEKSEVVSLLLREYEAGGADWLWQTDAARRITGVSGRFAQLLGVDVAELEGKALVQILAGSGWDSGQFAPALHDLAEKLKRRESFSGLTLPVEIAGRTCWWDLSASPRYDENGNFQGFRGVGSDVTQQRESADKISQLARFDPLTRLPNRLQVTEALGTALDSVSKWHTRSAFLMIDLDRFKAVNDTLGHQVGDKLLSAVADRLRKVCGEREFCGRIGGDEFAMVVRETHDTLYLSQLAVAIIHSLSQPYEIDQHTLYIGASVGSAVAPRDGDNPEMLIRSADLALYRAKDEGGGKHFAYEPVLHSNAEERRILEIALREALEKEQLHVVYQPVVNAQDGSILGFESLVRWTHPEMGAISPVKFIPVAEEARLISPIGEWVLRTACQEAANWPSDIRVAVNVSADQLSNPEFATVVMSALAHSGIGAHRLELEVTESVFMREGTGAVAMLDQLQGLGIKLSLDDFGTGYSSLGYLSRAKFTTIKVDRSFVQGAAKNIPESLAIIRAVVAMADSLGMSTTAEGVETAEEVDMINRLGCKKIQGYYFGRPMPANEARALFPAQQQQRSAMGY